MGKYDTEKSTKAAVLLLPLPTASLSKSHEIQLVIGKQLNDTLQVEEDSICHLVAIFHYIHARRERKKIKPANKTMSALAN